jgi:hypothetical protein
VVFWAPHAEKRPKTQYKKSKEKTTGKSFFSQLFWPKAFDMGFPQVGPKDLFLTFFKPLVEKSTKTP